MISFPCVTTHSRYYLIILVTVTEHTGYGLVYCGHLNKKLIRMHYCKSFAWHTKGKALSSFINSSLSNILNVKMKIACFTMIGVDLSSVHVQFTTHTNIFFKRTKLVNDVVDVKWLFWCCAQTLLGPYVCNSCCLYLLKLLHQTNPQN